MLPVRKLTGSKMMKKKIKNIRDFYRGINDFKRGYQPRTNVVKYETVIWLQTPRVLWLGGGTISPS